MKKIFLILGLVFIFMISCVSATNYDIDTLELHSYFTGNTYDSYDIEFIENGTKFISLRGYYKHYYSYDGNLNNSQELEFISSFDTDFYLTDLEFYNDGYNALKFYGFVTTNNIYHIDFTDAYNISSIINNTPTRSIYFSGYSDSISYSHDSRYLFRVYQGVISKFDLINENGINYIESNTQLSAIQSFNPLEIGTTKMGFDFNDDGTELFIVSSGIVYQYRLLNPYDLSNIEYIGNKDISNYISNPYSITLYDNKIFIKELSKSNRYYAFSIEPIVPPTTEYMYSIEQENIVTVVQNGVWTEIIAGNVTIAPDEKNYGSTTIQTLTGGSGATVECRTLVNGVESGDNIVRTNQPKVYGSIVLMRPDINESGVYNLVIECQKDGGSTQFLNTLGVGHILSYDAISFDEEFNISTTGNNQTLNSYTFTPSITGTLIFESSANVYAGVGTNLDLWIEANGQKCGTNKRYIETGTSGSIGLVCSIDIVSGENINIYLKSNSTNTVDINWFAHVKELTFSDSNPIFLTTINENPTKIGEVQVNNPLNLSKVYMRSSVSIQDNTQDIFFQYSVDGVNVGQPIPYSSFSTTKQSINHYLGDSPSDLFNVSLYVYSENVPSSPIYVEGGNLLVYPVQEIEISRSIFNISAYNVYTSEQLNTFFVQSNDVFYSTTDGNITIYTSDSERNITVYGDVYYEYNDLVSTGMNYNIPLREWTRIYAVDNKTDVPIDTFTVTYNGTDFEGNIYANVPIFDESTTIGISNARTGVSVFISDDFLISANPYLENYTARLINRADLPSIFKSCPTTEQDWTTFYLIIIILLGMGLFGVAFKNIMLTVLSGVFLMITSLVFFNCTPIYGYILLVFGIGFIFSGLSIKS